MPFSILQKKCSPSGEHFIPTDDFSEHRTAFTDGATGLKFHGVFGVAVRYSCD